MDSLFFIQTFYVSSLQSKCSTQSSILLDETMKKTG